MDIGLVASVVMLIVWAVGAFVLDAPGWIHLLLSAGMFVLIWRIAVITAVPRAPAHDAADRGGPESGDHTT
jgi:hypothetical protein